MSVHVGLYVVLGMLAVLLRGCQCAPKVRFDFHEEMKDLHPGKRALLVPHILPYSNGNQNQNLRDEMIILGSAAAIIRSNFYDEISLLEKYTDSHKLFPADSHHLAVLTEYAKSLPDNRSKVRLALVESNHTWQYWQDNNFQQFAAQYDAVYFIGADSIDGQQSCSNTHHRLRLMYVAAKSAHTVIMGVSFTRKRLDRCLPTLRFLRALLESNPNIWVVQDPSSLHEIQSIPAVDKTPATKLLLAVDPAFLSPSGLEGVAVKNIDDIVSRLEVDRLLSRRLVGLNLHVSNSKKVDHEKIFISVVSALCNIHNAIEAYSGLSIVFIPHDYSRDQSDITAARLLDRVARESCPSIAPYVYSFGHTVLTSMEVKNVIKNMDIMITTRLYVGIAALSVNIPTTVFSAVPVRCSYIGRLLGVKNLCGTLEQTADIAALTDFLTLRWQEHAEDRRRIIANKEKLEVMAMKNVLAEEG